MTIVSNGLWAYELTDAVGPPTQTFVTRRVPLAHHRPVVHVADEFGFTIGRLNGEVGPVVWRIDGYATVTLRLPPSEAERKSELLAHGNYVELEFPNGLPAWGGVIDPPRELPRDATTLTLYSAEYLFGWPLVGDWGSYVSDAESVWTPDAILSDALGRTEMAARYNLEPEGGVWGAWGDGPDPVTADGRGGTVLALADAVRSEASAFHWYVEPSTVPVTSSIRFILRRFYHFRRDRRNDAAMIEGHNLVNVEVIEQGPIYNYITVTAGNYDPDDPTRRKYIYRYGEARPRLRREMSLTLPDVIGSGPNVEGTNTAVGEVLAARARAEHARWSTPRMRIRGHALDMPPARFGSYAVGDVVNVVLNRQLTTTAVIPFLIIGLEFDPATGLLALVGETITGDQLRGRDG